MVAPNPPKEEGGGDKISWCHYARGYAALQCGFAIPPGAVYLMYITDIARFINTGEMSSYFFNTAKHKGMSR
jgi:hypothetical protein